MAKKIAVSLDLSGNEIKDFVVDARATAPAAKKGKFYFDTTSNALRYHNGTAWITIATGGSTEEMGTRLTTVETNLTALKEAFEAIGDVTDDAHGYMTPAQKKKLDGIAEGANKTVINNTLTSTSTTEALSAAQGKALNDKITTLDGRVTDLDDKIDTSVSDAVTDLDLEYVSASKQLKLKNSNGDISTIDVSAFVKDGMISGQALYKATAATGTVTINETAYSLSGLTAGHTYIVIVWNTDAGKDPMTIDVTTLIDVYTEGDGLKLENNKFTVVVDPDSEKLVDGTVVLTVSSKGLKIAGIANAISAAVDGLLGDGSAYDNGQTPNIKSLENLIHETTDQYFKKITSGTSVVLTPQKNDVDIAGISPSTVRCFYFNGTVEEEVTCDISVSGENVTVSWNGLTVDTTHYLNIYWRESYVQNEVA